MKERFGVPYSLCGCSPDPPPGTLSKLASRLFTSDPLGGTPAHDKRPDLVSIETNDVDATHPSEHNSAFMARHPALRKRREKRESRVQEAVTEAIKTRTKNEVKGKEQTWTDIQLQNRENERDDHREAYSSTYQFTDVRPYGNFGLAIHKA